MPLTGRVQSLRVDIDFSDKKLWIVGDYDYYEVFINLCFLKDYIYRCEYDNLSFNEMRVTYEDFKIISKTIKTFYAFYTDIEGPKDDEYLSVGDILATIPQIVEFRL
uniref:Uncharacterized protein n=1 Tax=Panagrolaimus sp. PS1159 TaxID=55785 RepID=A0AC35FH88_9BILA